MLGTTCISTFDRLRTAVFRSAFARGVAVLAGGTIAAQVLTILGSPVLTRLYTPTDFGALGVYSSLLAVVGVISAFRYELAIPLPRSDRTAAALLLSSLFFVLVTSLIVAGFIVVAPDAVYRACGAESLADWCWLIPIGLFGAGSYRTVTYWFIRTGRYRDIARTRLTQAVGQLMTQIGAGLMHGGVFGLLAGQVVAQSGGVVSLAWRAYRSDRAKITGFRRQHAIRVVSRYRDYPLYSSPGSIINTASIQLPVLLLAALYGTEIAGLFVLTQRVAKLPASVLGGAIAQVFQGEFPRALARGASDGKQLFDTTVGRSLAVWSVPAVIGFVLSPWLFQSVFGHEWAMAGRYAQLLMPMVLAQIVVGPVSQTLTLLGRNELQLGWEILRALLVLVALWLPSVFGASAEAAIAAYSAAMALVYSGMWLHSSRLLWRSATL